MLAKNPGKTLQANSTGTGKGYLGVGVVDITNQIRTQLGGYHDQGGVAVGQVPDGPAASAGIEPGNVIQAINGKPINSQKDLTTTIAGLKPGTQVTLRVWAQGVRKNVAVTLGEQPAELYLQQQDQQQQQQSPVGPGAAGSS